MHVKEGKSIDLDKNKFVQVVNVNVIQAFDIMYSYSILNICNLWSIGFLYHISYNDPF